MYVHCLKKSNISLPLFSPTIGEAHPDREPYARMKVDQMCQKAMDDGMTLPSKSVPWEKVANKGDNFDKQYYDGNTFWNEEFETNYDTTIIPGPEMQNV